MLRNNYNKIGLKIWLSIENSLFLQKVGRNRNATTSICITTRRDETDWEM